MTTVQAAQAPTAQTPAAKASATRSITRFAEIGVKYGGLGVHFSRADELLEEWEGDKNHYSSFTPERMSNFVPNGLRHRDILRGSCDAYKRFQQEELRPGVDDFRSGVSRYRELTPSELITPSIDGKIKKWEGSVDERAEKHNIGR